MVISSVHTPRHLIVNFLHFFVHLTHQRFSVVFLHSGLLSCKFVLQKGQKFVLHIHSGVLVQFYIFAFQIFQHLSWIRINIIVTSLSTWPRASKGTWGGDKLFSLWKSWTEFWLQTRIEKPCRITVTLLQLVWRPRDRYRFSVMTPFSWYYSFEVLVTDHLKPLCLIAGSLLCHR